MAIAIEFWKLQDDITALSDEKGKEIETMILYGSQHTAKTNTTTTDIFRTIFSLFKRCFLAFADCSPGILWDLILEAMVT